MKNELHYHLKDFNRVAFPGLSFPIITIYNSPLDFPGEYVARLFDLTKATPYFCTAATLEEIRKKMPYGKTCIPRYADDPESVVESWI